MKSWSRQEEKLEQARRKVGAGKIKSWSIQDEKLEQTRKKLEQAR